MQERGEGEIRKKKGGVWNREDRKRTGSGGKRREKGTVGGREEGVKR